MRSFLIFMPAFILAGFFLNAAPRRYDDDLQIQIKETRDSIEDLRREIRNHESEIRTFDEKSSTIDNALESIRKELTDSHQGHKELLKNNHGSLEMKINTLDTATKGLQADLKQIRTGYNDTQDALKLFKDRIQQLEKNIEAINRNVESLQGALNDVFSALKVESNTSPIGKSYKVKAGDSLEKIANRNGISLKELKRLNRLENDKIHVGQTLKLAE